MTDHRNSDIPALRQRIIRWAAPAAILLAGLLIAAAIDLASRHAARDRYQIAGDGRGVWRLDTRSGSVVRCVGAAAPFALTANTANTANTGSGSSSNEERRFPFPLPFGRNTEEGEGEAEAAAAPAPATATAAPAATPPATTAAPATRPPATTTSPVAMDPAAVTCAEVDSRALRRR